MLRSRPPQAGSGFTLLELMIAVAIVAIITAIALPSYLESVRKARRADARSSLTTLGQRLERCYTQYGTYNDAGCVITSPQNSAEDHYVITVQRAATTYTLTATPTGAQANDGRCTTLALNHLGQRAATGSHINQCW